MKPLVIITLTLILIFSLAGQGMCFWQGLPVPSGAEELKKEKIELAGREGEVIVYSSRLSFKEITNFYRINLVNSSWKEVPMGNSMVVFQKDDDLVTIKLKSETNKTQYLVIKNKTLPSGEEFENLKRKKAAEKFADIPDYPGAEINPFASVGHRKGYTTKDSAEKVLSFYDDKMTARGWEVVDVVPLSSQEYISPGLEDTPEYKKILEKLPKDTEDKFKDAYMNIGQIKFIKDNKICFVRVNQKVLPSNQTGNRTLITVVYSEDGRK